MLRDSVSSSRSSRHGRSSSLSMDQYRPVSAQSGVLSPPMVNPLPQYVAPLPASRLIAAANGTLTTINQQSNAVSISRDSLVPLNCFLDHILFNILLAARSTKLTAIRPAVSEVLRPRLAREIIAAADDELCEYTGGNDDEESSNFPGGQEPKGHFELERTWKLTRLRCMVYIRLGDIEEDDEEEFLQKEIFYESNSHPRHFSNHIGLITPAAAIFLTSILEYIAENALIIANENACNRIGLRKASDNEEENEYQDDDDTNNLEKMIVEEIDMEKIALNPTLGRLWRTWRNSLRVPMISRTLSRESLLRKRHSSLPKSSSRQSSVTTIETYADQYIRQVNLESPVSEHPESTDPADIPLPTSSDDDIDEIEGPKPVPQFATLMTVQSMRPRSLHLPGSDIGSPGSTIANSPRAMNFSPRSSSDGHTRSRSLPDSVHFSPPLSQFGAKQTPPGSPLVASERPETMPKVEESKEPNGAIDTDHSRSMEPDISLPSDNDDDDAASSVSSIHSEEFEVPHQYPSEIGEITPTHQGSSEESKHDSNVQKDVPESSPTVVSSSHPAKQGESTKTDLDEESGQTIEVEQKTVPDSTNKSPDAASQTMDDVSSPSTQDSIVETAFVPHPVKPNNKPPRLTPLREMVAAAGDSPPLKSRKVTGSSDRNSSSEESERSHTRRTKAWDAKPMTNGSAKQVHAVSPGIERAAVQRVTPPPSSISRDGSIRPRRSDSIGSHFERLQITSSLSSSTKLRGLVGRPSTGSSDHDGHKAKTDEAPSPLEELLRTDETIHYTLTPRNMREMEDPNSPRWQSIRNPLLRSKSSQQQARGAREEVTSVRQFADFIRTTGPGETEKSQSKARSQLKIDPLVATPESTITTSTAGTKAKNGVAPKRSLPQLEPRSPFTPKDGGTSELIEFLREGPAKTNHDTVGPDSITSTQGDSIVSSNSRTALLESPVRPTAWNRNNKPTPAPRPKTSNASFQKPDELAEPVRKQRRARDPYAIDSDDDDDEIDSRPKPREESLIDFLNNYTPPATANEQPPLRFSMDEQELRGQNKSPAKVKKKTSLKSRLRSSSARSSATSPRVPDIPPTGVVSAVAAPPKANFIKHTKSKSSEESPATFQPIKPSRRTTESKYIPRDLSGEEDDDDFYHDSIRGGPPKSSTAELADFFRNTAPPPPLPLPPPTAVSDMKGTRNSWGFSKIFRRKRQQSAF